MNSVDMSLDEIAAKEGIKGRRGRGRGRRSGGKAPVTSTQQRRKSIEQHNERSQKHRNERRQPRRLFDAVNKAEVVPVVFGNGTPEKVLTGRLTEAQVSAKRANTQAPINLVQAALDRGREAFLKSQARNRGKAKDKGGKRASMEPRKRPVIQHPLSRKLRIVRPGDPGYKRQLRQLRDRTLSVRIVRGGEQKKQVPKHQQQLSKRNVKSDRNVARDAAPAQRLLGPQSRRIVLGMSDSSSASGPLSSRFSSLKK